MSPTRVTPGILDKIDDHMDNMANAVTNEKAVLDQLVATNTKQASTPPHKPPPILPSPIKSSNFNSGSSTKGTEVVDEAGTTMSEKYLKMAIADHMDTRSWNRYPTAIKIRKVTRTRKTAPKL